MQPNSNYCALLLTTLMGLLTQPSFAQKKTKWEAPTSANELKNPFAQDVSSIEEGKKLFVSMCSVCHGETGKGNGAASVSLEPRPANFLSIEVEKESDGAIYWKLTDGNPPMAAYKTLLTDAQRWKLVSYIRNLESKAHEKKR